MEAREILEGDSKELKKLQKLYEKEKAEHEELKKKFEILEKKEAIQSL